MGTLFDKKIDTQINVTDFEGCNIEQIENVLTDWTPIMKSAMDVAIPKANYQFIYQLKVTPEKKKKN